jgi:aryl-alcohol dehydrogenase-like predicted oxidoreductase
MHAMPCRYAPRENTIQALAAYSQLANVLDDGELTSDRPKNDALVHLSMRWLLQRSFVSGCVVGARTPQQLSTVVEASLCEEPMPRDVLQAIDSIHERFPNPCP